LTNKKLFYRIKQN